MSQGIKYPLTQMLFLTKQIVREVLLVGTGAVTIVSVIAIGPIHMQGVVHTSRATPKNQYVITVRVHII